MFCKCLSKHKLSNGLHLEACLERAFSCLNIFSIAQKKNQKNYIKYEFKNSNLWFYRAKHLINEPENIEMECSNLISEHIFEIIDKLQ